MTYKLLNILNINNFNLIQVGCIDGLSIAYYANTRGGGLEISSGCGLEVGDGGA